MNPVEPLNFGNYQVLPRPDGSHWVLGQGAYGTTYKAEHRFLKRVCALKLIHERHMRDERERSRFLQEARTAANLAHPGIAQVYDFGESDGVFFYAMEFLEGGSLADLVVERAGPLDWSEVSEYGRQIAEALSCAHGKGLLHRDLKPQNVMLAAGDGSRIVKLIDFGLVKLINQPHSDSTWTALTREGTFQGNYATASPEQMDQQDLDERSDLFSLGVTLWWMLAGANPFEGMREARLIVDRLSGEPYVNRLPAGIAPEARELLGKLLERDPANRISSAREFVAMLSSGSAPVAPPVIEAPPPPSPTPPPLPVAARPSGLFEETFDVLAVYDELPAGKLYRCRDGADRAYAAMVPVPGVAERSLAALRACAGRAVPCLGFIGEWATEQGETVFVFDALDGTRLLDLLKQLGGARLAEVMPLLARMASAIDAADACGGQGLELNPHLLRVSAAEGRSTIASWADIDALSLRALPALVVEEDSAESSTATTVVSTGAEYAPGSQFPALIYRLVSGIAVKHTAFFTSISYVPVSALSEEGNSMLSRVISGEEDSPGALDLLRQLGAMEGQPVDSHVNTAARTAATALVMPTPVGDQRRRQEEERRRAQEEAERLVREDAERRAREEAERKAREEAERKAREEAERKAREEAERKAREEAERKAREEAERKAREEAERRAREEAERKAREEAERKAREEAERKAREEAERKAREEAERKAREEAERKAREEAERKAREEAERKAREEAERKAREEAERKAREEAERKAREEAERKAREEAERKAREEAERKAREEAERRAREDAERKAREEKQHKALTEAERKSRDKEAADKSKAERKAREDAERKAREDAERKAREDAERKAREDAERKAREDAERKAREDAERKAREDAERKAREDAERKAREDAERKAREDAERKAREEAERKAREEAERKAREEAERRARDEEHRRKAETDRKRQEAERKAREAEDRRKAAATNAEPPPPPAQSAVGTARSGSLDPLASFLEKRKPDKDSGPQPLKAAAEPPPTPPLPGVSPNRKRPVILVSAIAAVLALVVGLVIALGGKDKTKDKGQANTENHGNRVENAGGNGPGKTTQPEPVVKDFFVTVAHDEHLRPETDYQIRSGDRPATWNKELGKWVLPAPPADGKVTVWLGRGLVFEDLWNSTGVALVNQRSAQADQKIDLTGVRAVYEFRLPAFRRLNGKTVEVTPEALAMKANDTTVSGERLSLQRRDANGGSAQFVSWTAPLPEKTEANPNPEFLPLTRADLVAPPAPPEWKCRASFPGYQSVEIAANNPPPSFSLKRAVLNAQLVFNQVPTDTGYPYTKIVLNLLNSPAGKEDPLPPKPLEIPVSKSPVPLSLGSGEYELQFHGRSPVTSAEDVVLATCRCNVEAPMALNPAQNPQFALPSRLPGLQVLRSGEWCDYARVRFAPQGQIPPADPVALTSGGSQVAWRNLKITEEHAVGVLALNAPAAVPAKPTTDPAPAAPAATPKLKSVLLHPGPYSVSFEGTRLPPELTLPAVQRDLSKGPAGQVPAIDLTARFSGVYHSNPHIPCLPMPDPDEASEKAAAGDFTMFKTYKELPWWSNLWFHSDLGDDFRRWARRGYTEDSETNQRLPASVIDLEIELRMAEGAVSGAYWSINHFRGAYLQWTKLKLAAPQKAGAVWQIDADALFGSQAEAVLGDRSKKFSDELKRAAPHLQFPIWWPVVSRDFKEFSSVRGGDFEGEPAGLIRIALADAKGGEIRVGPVHQLVKSPEGKLKGPFKAKLSEPAAALVNNEYLAFKLFEEPVTLKREEAANEDFRKGLREAIPPPPQ